MAGGTRPALSDFPLLWRWNRDRGARLSLSERESIRPLPEDEAVVLYSEVVDRRDQHEPEECLNVDDTSDKTAVTEWVDHVIPNEAKELTLIWDRRTAARVPRVLYVRRWDDFWYPTRTSVGDRNPRSVQARPVGDVASISRDAVRSCRQTLGAPVFLRASR